MAERETYRSVVGVLLALAALGSVGLAMGGIVLANAVLVDAAVTLGLFAGMLVGVMLTQLTPLKPLESSVVLVPAEETSVDPTPVHVEGRSLASRLDAITRWRSVAGRAAAWLPDSRERANSRFATAAAGLGATLFIRMIGPTQPTALTFTTAGVAVLILAAGAGLTAVVVRYLTGLNATALPEAEGLSMCEPYRRVGGGGRGTHGDLPVAAPGPSCPHRRFRRDCDQFFHLLRAAGVPAG